MMGSLATTTPYEWGKTNNRYLVDPEESTHYEKHAHPNDKRRCHTSLSNIFKCKMTYLEQFLLNCS